MKVKLRVLVLEMAHTPTALHSLIAFTESGVEASSLVYY